MNRAQIFSSIRLPTRRRDRLQFWLGLLTGSAISAIVAAAAFIYRIGP
jgi:hypothetical protein